jgi:hypothetical protein
MEEQKMKYLLTCLLAGCLINPAWGTEREMALEEFVHKLEKAEPWTQKKVEARLGVKFTMTESTGIVTWHNAYEPLPSVKDLAIQYISLDTSAATDKTLSLRVYFDSKLGCLTLEQVEKLFPGGHVDAENMEPGGGLFYIHGRAWGELEFNFDSWRKEKSCLVRISAKTNNSLK